MYIVSVNYVKPLDEVDRHLSGHVQFLDEYYAKGVFIASGRKVPRSGGIIMAKGIGRGELEDILAQDPFKVNGVAVYDITEFVASKTSDEFAGLTGL